MPRGWAPPCTVSTGAFSILWRSSGVGCSCNPRNHGQWQGAVVWGLHGFQAYAQLCSGGGRAGEVKGAGQMLVQLLSRGDRWDK